MERKRSLPCRDDRHDHCTGERMVNKICECPCHDERKGNGTETEEQGTEPVAEREERQVVRERKAA